MKSSQPIKYFSKEFLLLHAAQWRIYEINIWKVDAENFVYSSWDVKSRSHTRTQRSLLMQYSMSYTLKLRIQSQTFTRIFKTNEFIAVSLNTIQWKSSLALFRNKAEQNFYFNSIYSLNVIYAIYSEQPFQILMRQSEREFISGKIIKYLARDAVSRHLFLHFLSGRAHDSESLINVRHSCDQ